MPFISPWVAGRFSEEVPCSRSEPLWGIAPDSSPEVSQLVSHGQPGGWAVRRQVGRETHHASACGHRLLASRGGGGLGNEVGDDTRSQARRTRTENFSICSSSWSPARSTVAPQEPELDPALPVRDEVLCPKLCRTPSIGPRPSWHVLDWAR